MKNFLIVLCLIMFASVLYLFTLRGDYGNATTLSEVSQLTRVGQSFESSHERSPYAMLVALTAGRVDLSAEWANFASPDVGYIGGKFYSFFPIGVPALIYPLYAYASHYDAGLLGAYAMMALLSIVSLMLIILIGKKVFRLPLWAAILAALIFGFASTSWSYAITIYQHAPTVTCMLLGFYAAWSFNNSKKFGWFWAALVGAAYGAAIFIDYPNALLMAPIMVYLILSAVQIKNTSESWQLKLRSSVLVGLLVFGVMTSAHLYYNQKVFGSAFQFHNPAPRYTPETFEKLQLQLQEKNNTKASSAVSIFNEQSLMRGLYELFVAPDKGIFFFSPVFLFALWGMIKLRHRYTMESITFLSIAVLNIFMYASFGDPWGGWAFGPRYLIPSMAILSIFAVFPIIIGGKKLIKKFGLLLLVAYSSAVAIVGVVTTNLVPPKVEADYLHLKYNYLRNLDFLRDGTSGNFIYNSYAASSMSLQEYAMILFGIVMALFFIVLFILPLFYKRENMAYAQSIKLDEKEVHND